MKIKDSNVTINIRNMEKSIAFYQSIGLIVKERWADHYAQITAPGLVIGLHPTSETNLKGESGNVSLGFTVDRFEEAESQLKELSIDFTTRKEEGGQFLHFSDPDGTEIYFIKPKW